MLKGSKLPVFWQCTVMYCLIAGIMILALMPLYYKALSISKESYLKESKQALSRYGMLFENTATAIWQIPQIMKQYQYYTDVKLYKNNAIPASSYFYLGKVRDFFIQQCYAFDDVEAGFIVFSNSGICMARNRIFQSANNCFAEYIHYLEYDPDTLITQLSDMDSQLAFLPATDVSIDSAKSRQYLTLIAHLTGESAIFGMLFSQDAILDLFSVTNLPKGSFFYITDVSENMLFSYEYDDSALALPNSVNDYIYEDMSYSVIRYSMTTLGCDAVIGIPDSYFTSLLAPLSAMNRLYIFAAIISGILLSVMFAFLQLIPVKRLLKGSLASVYIKKTPVINEYRFLGEVMENASAKIYQLHHDIAEQDYTLKANLFIRLLFGTVYLADELAQVAIYTPQLQSFCRVVLVYADIDNNNQPCDDLLYLKVYEHLSRSLPSQFLLAHLDPAKTAILVPDTKECLHCLDCTISQIDSLLQTFGVQLRAVGSESFSGIENVRVAFFQAQLGFDIARNDRVCYYKSKQNVKSKTIIDHDELQKLFELILAGEVRQTASMISTVKENLLRQCDCSSEDAKQVFYSMRFIVTAVITDANIDHEQFNLPYYNENDSVQTLFNKISSVAELVATTLLERKNNAGHAFAQRITTYIKENITDPSLCPDKIVNYFDVSRSFLYKYVKEVTTRSVSEYIEIIRMEKARGLLNSTKMSVGEIAGVCGYNSPNTFYKVFRKHHGVTPSAYRSS